jgi:hypothetical protein
MKHVGKMKNNSAKVAVVYRTLPGDPNSALVVGTNGLSDAYHDTLMSLIESDAGQQANELADIISVRRFPDGNVMLNYLHTNGHLKKVPTTGVLMTPNSQTSLPLAELNQIIADQKGVALEDLAVTEDGAKPAKKTSETKSQEKIVVDQEITVKPDPVKSPVAEEKPVTVSDLRSMADKLFKEAQALRKKADELDPPKKKAVKAKAEEA